MEEVGVNLKEKQLLFSLTKKDFVVETFRAGSKGGQNQNKRDSGVRIKHPTSGAVGESREHKSQLQNKKEAFQRLLSSDKFKTWHKIEVSRISGQSKTPEQIYKEVEKDLNDDIEKGNVKVEYF